MKKYLIFSIILIFIFCGEKEKIKNHNHTEHPEEHNHIIVTPEKQKMWKLQIIRVEQKEISSQIKLPGVISLDKNNTAYVSSPVSGKVVALNVDLGDWVKKGETLLIIHSPEFSQTKADFLKARANLNLRYREYERAKVLFKEKAIEEKEFLKREAAYQKALTEYGVLESKLHIFGIEQKDIENLINKCENPNIDANSIININERIGLDLDFPLKAPIEGKIIFRDVILGENISPEKNLFIISNLSTIWAILDAYEKDIPFIKTGSEVRIESSLYPDKKFKGRITYISDEIDEKLRTFKIRVEVDNKLNLLKPNMFITGIVENKREKFLVVPEEAVQNLNGKKIIFQ